MRECDLEKLPAGEIASIVQCSPEAYDISTDTGTIEAKYRIIVGGPDPANYRLNIWNMIVSFVPDVSKNQTSLPSLGSYVLVQDAYFVVKNIKLQVRNEADFVDCRKWTATVIWEAASKEKNPQNQEGVPLTPDMIEHAQATIRIRPGTESEPVEYAEFFGFFDGEGSPKDCSWIANSHVCQPLKGAFGKFIPVMNSVGVRFDPGLTRESGIDRIVISKPYSSIPFGISKALRNKINCDRFFILEFRNGIPIFGADIAPFTARVSEISHSFEKMSNGYEYPVLHVELAIKSNRFEYLDEFNERQYSEDFGWADLIANRGSSMLVYPGLDDYNGGTWPDPPTKQTGGRSSVPITIDNQTLNDPQWLDCNGLPLIDPGEADPETCAIGLKPEDIVYLGYMNYGRIKFASDNFPGFLGNCFFNTNPSGPGSLPPAFFPNWSSTQDLSGTVLESLEDFEDC